MLSVSTRVAPAADVVCTVDLLSECRLAWAKGARVTARVRRRAISMIPAES
jgi:hypothetical protein